MKINLNKKFSSLSLKNDVGVFGMAFLHDANGQEIFQLWDIRKLGFEYIEHEILVFEVYHEN